jgi:hypothetical protein
LIFHKDLYIFIFVEILSAVVVFKPTKMLNFPVMPPGWYPGAGGQEPYARHAAQLAAQYPGGLRGDWAGQVGQAAWHQAPGYGFQQAGEEEEEPEEGDEEEEEEAQAPYQQHGNNARDF